LKRQSNPNFAVHDDVAEVYHVIRNLIAFALAATLEIGGCFAFWLWLRQDRFPLMGMVGVSSLIGFAVTLTRVDAAFAGRAFAAYGGICIAASLVWLWLVEGQRPRPTDLLGAAIAILGAPVIIGLAPKSS
jgi:small multidrug resistance family-3 protein